MAGKLTTKAKQIILISGLSLYASSGHAALQDLFVDLDITAQSDSNINQAKLDSDAVEDNITEGSLRLGYNYTIDNMSLLTFSTGIKAKQYQDTRSQNSQSGLFNISFMWQNNIGYRSPLYRLSFDSEIENNNTKQQDSTHMNLQFTVTSRLTDVITATGGLGHNMRDSESTVYDLSNSRLFSSGDYLINKRLTLYSTISLIKGETFSVIRPDTDEELLIALTAGKKNIQWDDAFNKDYPSQVTRWQAYRIDADTRVFALGMNFGFGHGNSFDLSFTRADVEGDGDADYQRDIINGSLLKRF